MGEAAKSFDDVKGRLWRGTQIHGGAYDVHWDSWHWRRRGRAACIYQRMIECFKAGTMHPKTTRVTLQTRPSSMTSRATSALRGGREVAYGRGGISIQRHLAELQVKILSKHTFKIGVAILTSLMRDRYSSASRSEQRQMYSTVSRVATLLTTQFTAMDFWMVGLGLFQAAAGVITQLDELMHMRACIDLAQKFLGDDRQRKELLAAAASLSATGSEEADLNSETVLQSSSAPVVSQLQSQSPAQLQSQAQAQSALSDLLAMEAEAAEHESSSFEPEFVPELDEPDPDLSSEEDPDLQLARAMTMEELSQEIQAILRRVNLTFTGRSQALADKFIGLQEAIQATLQEINNVPQGPPPAAKEEIEKLAMEAVTENVLARIGEGTQCAVCREALAVGDILQQMPCLHPYHPECLKPWLEKHNSCPICRFELRTDDEDYERQKHEDQQVEDQRRHIHIALKEDELLRM